MKAIGRPAARGLLLLALLTMSCSTLRLGGRPKLLFDQGHRQLFFADRDGPLDLSRFAAVLEDRGFLVETSTGELSSDRLSTFDVLIISGPFSPLTSSELDAVTAFVEQGGQICLMLHVAPPLQPLLHRLDISASERVVYEQRNVMYGSLSDFLVTSSHSHDLTDGVDAFVVHGSWALFPAGGNAQPIAETSPAAWVDSNANQELDEEDIAGALPIAVAGRFGRGRFAIFGDDAVFQNQFLSGGNLTLAENLAKWLMKGSR